ncbi:MAG: hypothetical protein WC197_03215 [Candidatus Gastranaerophilaceae bacterium]|jgi:hypothetical protein
MFIQNVSANKTYNAKIFQHFLQSTANTQISLLVSKIGENVQLPDSSRNYCLFNQEVVAGIVSKREQAVPYVVEKLKTATDEKVIAEGIYVFDRMIDAGVKGIEKTYPILSRFNNTTSPTIQTFLAGIYRKTQVPDAFGPLLKMIIRNSFLPPSTTCPNFDPNEEIGGAILDYLRNKSAQEWYKKVYNENNS